MPATTPRHLTPEIRKLARELAPTDVLVVVPVVPEAQSVKNECFENVRLKVARSGGEIVYGWAFWEWPKVFLEAEFHAIWRTPSGELIDLSPKRTNEQRILFISDPVRVFEGRQINNIRVPLCHDQIVLEFIQTADKIFEVTNRGDLADRLGYVSLPADEIMPLLNRKQELLSRMVARYTGRNTPCSCGSGRKFKTCCGK